jgi:hypothetical protein
MNTRSLFVFLWAAALGWAFTVTANATEAVYDVHGRLKAVFPDTPEAVGILGKGKHASHGFLAVDSITNVVYRAAYGIEDLRYDQSAIPQALNDYINGEALALGASVAHRSVGAIGSKPGAYYTLDLTYKGFPARIFAAVMYSRSRFVTWGVQDMPGLSSGDGAALFSRYVEHFQAL